MADKLAKVKAYIDSKLPGLEGSENEIAEMIEEEFNPSDWSGGNFDDAYYIGTEHGTINGKLEVIRKIKAIIDGEDE